VPATGRVGYSRDLPLAAVPMEPILDYFTMLAAATRTVLTSGWPQNWRRFKFLFLFAVVWPAMKLLSLPCLVLDYVLYPGFRKVEVREPLFIVGNWRTGSTLLYRALARDEEDVACFRMIDAFLPAITMKRAAAWLGRLDARVGGHGIKVLLAFDESFLADWSKIHDTGFLKPEEDEHVLLNDLCSAAMFELFPMIKRFRRLFFVDQEMPRVQQEFVMRRYKALAQRQLYHLGPNKRFVSKNPLFTFKIRALARHFPDARFVCLVRNPVSTVLSTASLFHFVWHETGALPPGARDMGTVLEFCHQGYQHAALALSELSPDRWAVVRFDDLVANPGGAIAGLWDRFGWPVAPTLAAVIAEAGAHQRRWKTKHAYDATDWGITAGEIYRDFQYVYREHGFDPPVEA
jgi:hypothetical protein